MNNSGYLLENDADINWRDNRGINALYWASSNGHQEIPIAFGIGPFFAGREVIDNRIL